MKKRFLSMLLALSMIFSMMPVSFAYTAVDTDSPINHLKITYNNGVISKVEVTANTSRVQGVGNMGFAIFTKLSWAYYDEAESTSWTDDIESNSISPVDFTVSALETLGDPVNDSDVYAGYSAFPTLAGYTIGFDNTQTTDQAFTTFAGSKTEGDFSVSGMQAQNEKFNGYLLQQEFFTEGESIVLGSEVDYSTMTSVPLIVYVWSENGSAGTNYMYENTFDLPLTGSGTWEDPPKTSEDTEITSAKVTVTEPKAGEAPSTAAALTTVTPDGSATLKDQSTNNTNVTVTWTDGSGNPVSGNFAGGQTYTATVKLTAADTYIFPSSFTAGNWQINGQNVSPSGGGTKELTMTYSWTLAATEITAANVTVDVPAAGKVPDTVADATITPANGAKLVDQSINSSGATATWTGDLDASGNYLGGNGYTVKVILEPNAGFSFPADLSTGDFKINGEAATSAALNGSNLELTYTYTLAKQVREIAWKTNPTISYTAGNPLDLSAAVVTLTYTNNTTEDVSYADFTNRGLAITCTNTDTTTVSHGDSLTTANDGAKVKVTYTAADDKGTNIDTTVASCSTSELTLEVNAAVEDVIGANIVIDEPALKAQPSTTATAEAKSDTSGNAQVAVQSAAWDGTLLTSDSAYTTDMAGYYKGGTEYTLTVTLKAANGYKFPASITMTDYTVNGKPVTSATLSGDTLTLTYKASTPATAVESITAGTGDNLKYTYADGENADNSGGRAKVTYTDGRVKDNINVSSNTDDVKAYWYDGTSTYTELTGALTYATHNGKDVYYGVTYGGTTTYTTAAVATLTVEKPRITEVEATFAYPVAGADPASTGTAPDGAVYSVSDITWFSETEYNKGQSGTGLSTGDKFDYNTVYVAMVTFTISNTLDEKFSATSVAATGKDSTAGSTAANATDTITGDDLTDEKEVIAVFTMPVTGKKPITATQISVDVPAPKATPDTTAEKGAGDEGYTITSGPTWTKTTDSSAVSGTFDYDTGYTMSVTIKADEGYEFSSGTPSINVPNSSNVTVTAGAEDGTYVVTATFPNTGSRTQIDSAALTITNPVPKGTNGANNATSADTNPGYTVDGTATWTGAFVDTDKFDYNTQYTTTVTLTADDDHRFASGLSVNVNGSDANVSVTVDSEGKTATVTYTPTTVDKTPIAGGTLAIGKPKANTAPAATAAKNDLFNYTINDSNKVTWSTGSTELTSSEKFNYSTVYSASVTLTPNEGYKWAESLSFTIDDITVATDNTANGTITKNDDGSVTVTVNYPATEDRKKITSLAVTGVTVPGATQTSTTSGIATTAKVTPTGGGEATTDSNAVTQTSAQWLTGDTPMTVFTGNYRGGSKYTISVTVKPNEGYDFDTTLTATVADGSATHTDATVTVDADAGTATVTYTYDVANLVIQSVDSVFDEPKPCESVSDSKFNTPTNVTVSPNNALASTTLKWTNADGSDITETEFLPNKTYKATVVYTAADNYEFANTSPTTDNYKANSKTGYTSRTVSENKKTVTITYEFTTDKNPVTAVELTEGTINFDKTYEQNADVLDHSVTKATLTRRYGKDGNKDEEVAFADFESKGISIVYSDGADTPAYAEVPLGPSTLQLAQNGKAVYLRYTDPAVTDAEKQNDTPVYSVQNQSDVGTTDNPQALGTLDVRYLWTVTFYDTDGTTQLSAKDHTGVTSIKVFDGEVIPQTTVPGTDGADDVIGADEFVNSSASYAYFNYWKVKDSSPDEVITPANDATGTKITKDLELVFVAKLDKITSIWYPDGSSLKNDTYGEGAYFDPDGVIAALTWVYESSHTDDASILPTNWETKKIKIYYSSTASSPEGTDLTELTLTTPLTVSDHNGKYLYLGCTDTDNTVDGNNLYAVSPFGQLKVVSALKATLHYTTDKTGAWSNAEVGAKREGNTLTQAEIDAVATGISSLFTNKWVDASDSEVTIPATFGSTDMELWAQAQLAPPTNVQVTTTTATWTTADTTVTKTNENGGFNVTFDASPDTTNAVENYTVTVKNGETVVESKTVAVADVSSGVHFDASAETGKINPGTTYTVEVVANPMSGSHKTASAAATGTGTAGKMCPIPPAKSTGKYKYGLTNGDLTFVDAEGGTNFTSGWAYTNASAEVHSGIYGQQADAAFTETDYYIGVSAYNISRYVEKGDVTVTTAPTITDTGKLVVGQTVTIDSASAVAVDEKVTTQTLTGTWAFINGSDTLSAEGTNTITYQFTPTDTGSAQKESDYNTTTGTITVNNVVQQYTVTLMKNDGTSDPYYTEKVDKGSKITTGTGGYTDPDDRVYLGHGFDGWYDAAVGGNKVDIANTAITAETTLYAHWTTTTYNITFDLGYEGATGAPSSITGLSYGATITAPTEPTRTGYAFKGWYYDADGNSTNGEEAEWTFGTGGTQVQFSATLVAKWEINTFTVTWYTYKDEPINSDVTTKVKEETVDWGSTLTPPELTEVTGYQREDKWYTSNAFATEWNMSDPVKTVLNLYTKWTPKPVTVKFHYNYEGAPGDGLWTGYSITNGGMTYDVWASMIYTRYGLESKEPTRAHHKFENWYWDENKTASYEHNTTTDHTLIQDKTGYFKTDTDGNYYVDLYAGWTEVMRYFTIYKDTDTSEANKIYQKSAIDGTLIDETFLSELESQITSNTVKLTEAADKSAQGKTFTGWDLYRSNETTVATKVNDTPYTADNVISSIKASNLSLTDYSYYLQPHYETMKIYVHWMKTADEELYVTPTTPTDERKDYNAKLGPYPVGSTPTRTHYTFADKWYKDAACTIELGTEYYNIELTNGGTLDITEKTEGGSTTYHVYVYAGWTANKYTVNFVYNFDGSTAGGGTTVTKTTVFGTKSDVEYNTTITALGTTPTRNNYTFDKWYKDAACTTAWDFTNDVVEDNTTLYAGWTPDPSAGLVTISGDTNITAFTDATLTAKCTESSYSNVSFKWYSVDGATETEITAENVGDKYVLSGTDNSVLTVKNFQAGDQTKYKAVLVIGGTEYPTVYDEATLTLQKIATHLGSSASATSSFTYSGNAVTADDVLTGVGILNTGNTGVTLVNTDPATYNKEYVNATGIVTKMYNSSNTEVSEAKNAGIYKLVFSLGEDSHGNYATATDKEVEFTVNPVTLTVTVGAFEKTYNKTNTLPSKTLTKAASEGAEGLSGFLGSDGDGVSVNVTGTYNGTDAGTYTAAQITPTLGTLTGESSGNYKLPETSDTAHITYSDANEIKKAALSLDSVENSSKSMKTGTTLDLSTGLVPHFSGLVGGDTVSSYNISGYANKAESGGLAIDTNVAGGSTTETATTTGTETFKATVFVNDTNITKNYDPDNFTFDITVEVADTYKYGISVSKRVDTLSDTSKLISGWTASTYTGIAGTVSASSTSVEKNGQTTITATEGTGFTLKNIALKNSADGGTMSGLSDATGGGKYAVYQVPDVDLEAAKTIEIEAVYEPVPVEFTDKTMAPTGTVYPGTAVTYDLTPATSGSGSYSYEIVSTDQVNCTEVKLTDSDTKVSFIPSSAGNELSFKVRVTDTVNGTTAVATYSLGGSDIKKNTPSISISNITVTYDNKTHGVSRGNGFTISNYPDGKEVTVKYKRTADGDGNGSSSTFFSDADFPMTGNDSDWVDTAPTNAGMYTVKVSTAANDGSYETVSTEATITIQKDTLTPSLSVEHYVGASLLNWSTAGTAKSVTATNDVGNKLDISGTYTRTGGAETVSATAGSAVTIDYTFTPTSDKDKNNFQNASGTDGKITAIGKQSVTVTLDNYSATYGSVDKSAMEDATLSLSETQVTQDGGTIQYQYKGTSTDGTYVHTTWYNEMPTVVGTYDVMATYVGTQYSGSDTATLTITPKGIEVDWQTIVGEAKTFDNEATATVKSGGPTIVESDILTDDKDKVKAAIQTTYKWSTQAGADYVHAGAEYITGKISWKTDNTDKTYLNYTFTGGSGAAAVTSATHKQGTNVTINPKEVTAQSFPTPSKPYDGNTSITTDANGNPYALTKDNFSGWVSDGSAPTSFSLSKTVSGTTYNSQYTSANANDDTAQDITWYITFGGDYAKDYYIASKGNTIIDDISVQGYIKRKVISFTINNDLNVSTAPDTSAATAPAGTTVDLRTAGHTLAELANSETLEETTDYTITYELASDTGNTGIGLDTDGYTTTMAGTASATPAEFTATVTLTSDKAKNYKFDVADTAHVTSADVSTGTIKVTVSDTTPRDLNIQKDKNDANTRTSAENIAFGTAALDLYAVPSADDGESTITWSVADGASTDIVELTQSADGKVTVKALKAGTTTLKATISQTATYSSATKTVQITVTRDTVTVDVTPLELIYNAQDRKNDITVTVKGKDADGSDKTLTEGTDFTVVYHKGMSTAVETTDVKNVADYYVTVNIINDAINQYSAPSGDPPKVTIKPAGLTIADIEGTPTYKQQLTAGTVSGAGEETPTYTLQWYVADAQTGGGTPISGETAQTYLLDDYNDVGKYIYVVATGTDNYNGSTAESGRVLISPITLTGTVGIDYTGKSEGKDALKGTELSPDILTIDQIDNLDQTKFTYEWYIAGESTPIATTKTYTVTDDTAGKNLYVKAIYDYQGYKGEISSSPLNTAYYKLTNNAPQDGTNQTLSMTKQYLYNEFSNTVTITNNSNRAVTPKYEITGVDNGKFTISPASPLSEIAADGTATLTITPQTGLEVGTYTATVRVLDQEFEQKGAVTTFNIKFVVAELTKHVKFLNDDDTVILEDDIAYGSSITRPNPSKDHYDFVKWVKVNGDGTTEDIDNSVFNSITEDLTVKAVYSPKSYTVKFLDNDGNPIAVTINDAAVTEQTVVYNQAATVATPPAVANYTFAGWVKDGTTDAVTDFSHISEDITVRATYTLNKFTVIFQDENGTEIKKVENVTGGTSVESEAPNLAVTGKALVWIDIETDAAANLTNIMKDTTVKASYSINKYTVTFYKPDGTTVISDQVVDYGSYAVVPTEESISDMPENYHIAKWVDTTTDDEVTNFTNITTDIRVKAVYAIDQHTVTFLDKDGETIGEAQKVDYGSDAVVPTAPSVDHYTFEKWVDKTTQQEVTEDGFKNITADMTVKAVYKIEQHTVTFQKEDGTEIEKKTVDYGSSVTAPTPDPIEGYEFAGWIDTATNEAADLTSVTKDITVKAKYAKNVKTVTFLDKDGNTIGDPQKVEYGSDATVATAPSVDHYHFVKWVDTTTQQEVTEDGFKNVKADITVQAEYEIDRHTVTFLNEDGTEIEKQTVDYGTDVTAPTATVPEDYEFVGWINTATNESVSSFDNITEDLTVKAETKRVWFNIVNTTTDTNGTVEVPSKAKEGDSVTITTTPASGYKISTILVSDSSNNEVLKISPIINTNTFKMPADDVTVTVTFKKSSSSSGGGGGGGSSNSITIRYEPEEGSTDEGKPVPTKGATATVGDISKLVATFAQKITNTSIIWTTSDSKIATVDNNGVVTFISEGEVTITATSQANRTLTEKVEITVLPAPESTFEPTPVPTERPKEDSKFTKDMMNPYIIGYDDNVFGPELPISREEVATIFARLIANEIYMDKEYTSKFWDVTDTDWSRDYIGYLEGFDILHGYDDGSFMPKAYITRAEMAVMMARAEGYDIEGYMSGEETGYPDIPESYNTWATIAIKYLTEAGVMQGYEDGTFRADRPITRAETVATINRVLSDMYADPIEIIPSDMTDAHWAYEDVVFAMNHRVLKDVAADPNKFVWSEEFDKNMKTIEVTDTDGEGLTPSGIIERPEEAEEAAESETEESEETADEQSELPDALPAEEETPVSTEEPVAAE